MCSQGLCAFIMGICLSFNDGSAPSFSKDSLCQLIEKRVGLEAYVSKLSEVSRHEVYSKAAKQPQIRAKHSAELLLEYEFCRLFKALEAVIGNALGAQRDLMNGLSELSLSEKENGLLMQYKELIRDQDRRLHELLERAKTAAREREQIQAQMEDLRQTNCLLEDQNTLLKAQLSTGAVERLQSDPESDSNHADSAPQKRADGIADERVKELEAENATKDEELDSLRKDQEDLLDLLTHQDLKLNNFKMRLKELGEDVDEKDSDNDNNSGEDVNSDADDIDM